MGGCNLLNISLHSWATNLGSRSLMIIRGSPQFNSDSRSSSFTRCSLSVTVPLYGSSIVQWAVFVLYNPLEAKRSQIAESLHFFSLLSPHKGARYFSKVIFGGMEVGVVLVLLVFRILAFLLLSGECHVLGSFCR